MAKNNTIFSKEPYIDLTTKVDGLYAYKEKRMWSFGNGIKKNGFLSFPDLSLELNIQGKNLEDFPKKFNYAAAKSDFSRIKLFDLNGYKRIPFYSKSDLYFTSMLAVVQNWSNKEIPVKIKNIECEIPGIHTFFNDNLLDFDGDSRSFKNKKNYYFDVELPPYGTLKMSTNFQVDFQYDRSFRAVHNDLIRIEFSNEQTYWSAVIMLKVVEEFFNFLFKEQTNQIIFSSDLKGPRKKISPTLSIISLSSPATFQLPERESAYSLLFEFEDIRDEIKKNMIKYWFNNYEEIREIWESIKTCRSGNASDITKFLSLISSVESFHKRFLNPVTDKRKKEHKEWLKKVTAPLSEDDAEKLKSMAAFGFEFSLRGKMKDIEAFCIDAGAIGLDDEIIKKIVNTRNNYVHALKMSSNKLLTSVELFRVNRDIYENITAKCVGYR